MNAAIRGRSCSVDDAVEAAAGLLSGARFPLVFGLVDSTVEAQREAVRVARLIGGVLDTAASSAQAGALASFQRGGLLSASLGEMRRRADLVVFWGCDPDTRHPGFVDRFAPPRPGRHRVAVDVGASRGPATADERLTLADASEVAALCVLRAVTRGRRLDEPVASAWSLPVEPLRALARRLRGCGYGVIVADGEPERPDPARPHLLAGLARDVRPAARLRVLAVRSGNAVGAESVLTWLTGFPASVSFASGRARFGPGEWSGETLLARGDVDAALILGADPARWLSATALRGLAATPSVHLAPAGAAASEAAAVFVATVPLEDSAGHRFRMDGLVPAPRLRGAGRLPDEAVVLAKLAEALARSRGAA